MLLTVVLLALHILAAMFWVGGMAFAYAMLRPATGPLDPPVRLALWERVLARFLPAVGVSIVALVVSGYWLVFHTFGGFAGAALYIHVMQGLGILMMLIYLHLMFAPWKRFRAAVLGAAFPEAARQLNQIRILVAVNLVLGIATVVVGGTGRFW
jgi:uncharacterized membrane protein